MSVRLSNAAARAACDSINALLNQGAGADATLTLYAGARPANVNDAITGQTALVTFVLPSPAFAPAINTVSGGHATANAIATVQAIATGTAAFFRTFDKDGNAVFDGSITDTAGNGDLKLSSTAVISGIDVSVVSLTTIMPKA